MEDKGAPDLAVARIATAQHGAVSTRQLYAAGLSKAQISRRSRNGHLLRLHRGVYAVGHIAPSPERRWSAAVLAVAGSMDGGHGALLSHRSAAELWGLLPPADGPVDVSWPGRGGKRRQAGLRIHRPISMPVNERDRHRGIPVTSPTRTLMDLRNVTSAGLFRRAVRQAEVLDLPIGVIIDRDRTRSELERRFLWLCSRNGLPAPAVNLPIGTLTVDFCWLDRHLVVETDGYRYHRGHQAFQDDRSRDLSLRSLGFEVLRLSHSQVYDDPVAVVTVLRALLFDGAR